MPKTIDQSYLKFINQLKTQIKAARIKAHLAVNRELILLYFEIGQAILKKQKEEKWGSRIIERVAKDLKSEFPDMAGLSSRNMIYMKQFAEKYEKSITQQAVAQLADLPFFNIPWGHNVVLMDQNFTHVQSLWYANEIIKNGWSRNVLIHQIKNNLFARQTSSEKT